jgi:hypothetical protein
MRSVRNRSGNVIAYGRPADGLYEKLVGARSQRVAAHIDRPQAAG